jgi:hypothetical protein
MTFVPHITRYVGEKGEHGGICPRLRGPQSLASQ